MNLQHGGDLVSATKTFGQPQGGWLDLSTGISPWCYPIPELPEYVWRNFPYELTPLINAAADYYQCSQDCVTPVAGTQDAIRRIPLLLSRARVAVPAIGYGEHRLAWSQAGHEVIEYNNPSTLESLVGKQQVDHVIMINPNNPSAEYTEAEWLLSLRHKMKPSSLLLVDEAFMDADDTYSLTKVLPQQGILVLRSIGKFFGLAGLRLGFILGQSDCVDSLRQQIKPWGVNYPAVYIAEKALKNIDWQQQQRQRIRQQSQQLVDLLQSLFKTEFSTTGLFTTILGERDGLNSFYHTAGKSGILLRYEQINPRQAWLRVGLPGNNWQRLKNCCSSTVLTLET